MLVYFRFVSWFLLLSVLVRAISFCKKNYTYEDVQLDYRNSYFNTGSWGKVRFLMKKTKTKQFQQTFVLVKTYSRCLKDVICNRLHIKCSWRCVEDFLITVNIYSDIHFNYISSRCLQDTSLKTNNCRKVRVSLR